MTLPWLVSPAFDLAFVAGGVWVLALVPGLVTADQVGPLHFWQLYFLTTPHRWLTLLLVAADPDRRAGRGGLFAGLAVLVALAVIAVRVGTGALLCLALVDFLWNGWHFAAQHAGILAIYGKRVGGVVALEKYGLRAVIVYVIVRSAGWALGGSAEDTPWAAGVEWADAAAAGLLGVIWLSALPRATRAHAPKLAYLASVSAVYLGLLAGVHWQSAEWTLRFALGSTILHATEYLAVVTTYAWRRQHVGTDGLFRDMAFHWLPVLAAFVLLVGFFESNAAEALGDFWVGLNLWASFLHYAYDGLIWKLRRPETAKALEAAA